MPDPVSKRVDCSRMKWNKIRNLCGFWLLGLCNNIGYAIMLSAAHDILEDDTTVDEDIHVDIGPNISVLLTTETLNGTSQKLIADCNTLGTGVILLADVLPALIIKLTAPWYIQRVSYRLRVIVVTSLVATSYLVVALASQTWLILIGVATVSCGMGIGEISFLSLTSQYKKNTVSFWSSGTGAAGLVGSLVYASLTALDIKPQTALLIMLVVPVILITSYFLILTQPDAVQSGEVDICLDDQVECPSDNTITPEAGLVTVDDECSTDKCLLTDMDDGLTTEKNDECRTDEGLLTGMDDGLTTEKNGASLETDQCTAEAVKLHISETDPPQPQYIKVQSMTLLQKLKLLKPILKYILSLCLVYFVEYFINQALFELIYFEDIWLPVEQQYRWYQTIFRSGVFVAKSSVSIIKIKRVWVLAILQLMVLGLSIAQVLLQFIPSIWIMFVVILLEGLIGGCTYVNTYYRITVEVKDADRREYSMGVTTLADSLGVFVAGVVSLPVHNVICDL